MSVLRMVSRSSLCCTQVEMTMGSMTICLFEEEKSVFVCFAERCDLMRRRKQSRFNDREASQTYVQ